nr:chorismate-binding protein [Acidipropionibacterium virtanenii]
MPVPDLPPLISRDLSGSTGLADLDGSAWLVRVAGLLPAGIERPRVWVAPDADDAPCILGWGAAARFTGSSAGGVLTSWEAFRQWARHTDADPVALGSFPFAREQTGDLVVPAVTLIRRAKGRPTEVLSSPDAPMPHPAAGREALPAVLTEIPQPGAEDAWRTAVESAVAALDADPRMQKVVLARALELSASHPMDQMAVATALASRFTGCWTYAHDGLVGATPELLVDLRAGRLRSRVLAGTRKPAWSEELLSDPKEQREHELAVASVTQVLESDGVLPRVDGPFLLRLPNVTHLATDITAQAGGTGAAHFSAARIVDALHPTAAVCGTPREEAYRVIDRVEELDRGRFSGPVGWMTADGSGQWGIALRCGQFAPGSRNVKVFAGAGIMPSSDPAKEWLETGAKMEAFLHSL